MTLLIVFNGNAVVASYANNSTFWSIFYVTRFLLWLVGNIIDWAYPIMLNHGFNGVWGVTFGVFARYNTWILFCSSTKISYHIKLRRILLIT